jgi:sterol desaturase/sphingolipid hydroxylase (fatty acid hydroxylase superfamily)
MNAETGIRLGFFTGVFLLLAILERLSPRRIPTTSKSRRWFANLVIVALNPLSVRLVFPVLPLGVALLASERHWGVLNNLAFPIWLETALGVIALDLTVYLQHVLHHAIPLLWRLHMVHHSDLNFDCTTGMRFHPIEIVLSMALKISAILALGPPVMAVLIFEVALNATSMFNHSNIYIPEKADRLIRLCLVTPDMHRVHHSVIVRETNSNYGFCFPWWDRLLGTYKNQPEKGHLEMTIGLSQFRDENRLTLPKLLLLPFVGNLGKVPINLH